MTEKQGSLNKQEKQDQPEKKVEPPPPKIDPQLAKVVQFNEKPRGKTIKSER